MKANSKEMWVGKVVELKKELAATKLELEIAKTTIEGLLNQKRVLEGEVTHSKKNHIEALVEGWEEI